MFASKIVVPTLATFLILILTGCGASVASISGKVTYNGSPLNKPEGTIVLVGNNGKELISSINPDGTYQISGVPVGEYRVAVFYKNPNAPTLGSGSRKLPERNTSAKSAHPPSPYLTPEGYASPATSQLAVKVEADTVYNPNLTGPQIR